MHQILLDQRCRALQDRARNGDVVDCERDDDPARQMRIVGDALRQADAAGDIDIFEDAQNDFLEQSVLGDVALGDAVIKQIRDTSQKGAALLGGGLSRQFQQIFAWHSRPPIGCPFEVSM